MEEKLLNIKELADFLGVSHHYVYYMVKTKRIPYVRVAPKTIRFRWSTIEQWLKEKTVKEEVQDVSAESPKRKRKPDRHNS